MIQNKLNPNECSQFSVSDWIDFFYSTEESVFEAFFKKSQFDLGNHKKFLVPKLTLNEKCILNCQFCHFQRNLSDPSSDEGCSLLFSPDQLNLTCQGINQLEVSHLIIEAGVFPQWQQHDLECQLEQMRCTLDSTRLLLDIGSKTFLDNPSIAKDSEAFFLDYVPKEETHAKQMQVFDKQSDLINQIQQPEHQERLFYANFIVDLPGLSFKDVVEDILYLVSLPIHGVKISPFLPAKQTMFEIFEKACLLTTLKVICMIRLLKTDWDIFVSPNIQLLGFPDAMKRALSVGANYAIFDWNSILNKLTLPLDQKSVQSITKMYGYDL